VTTFLRGQFHPKPTELFEAAKLMLPVRQGVLVVSLLARCPPPPGREPGSSVPSPGRGCWPASTTTGATSYPRSIQMAVPDTALECAVIPGGEHCLRSRASATGEGEHE